MDEAEQISANYLTTIDTTLSSGEITLDGQTYLVEINDDNGNHVAKLSIDMLTGAIRPVF